MKIQDLTPPRAVPEPAWKQQLVEFWQRADDHHKLDLEVTLKMGDAAGARRVIESWQHAEEQRRKKIRAQTPKRKKQRVRYGYGGYWFPGTAYAGQDHPAGAEGSGQQLSEGEATDQALQQFFKEIVADLDIEQAPKIVLHHDSNWSKKNGTFGRYDPKRNSLELTVSGRHVMDIVRTMAHELVHCRQNEISQLPGHAGETGSPWEDEANAVAGRILRGVAARHPELFKHDVAESSGYIPTEKERNDPRFKMALSPDVKPGATGKNANRMALKTGPQGEPTLLMKELRNALREFKETDCLPLTEDQDLFEIDMSPSNLRRLVRDIDAQAGIEFEMIVPGVRVDDDDAMEPDWDTDERVNSISDAHDFFFDGDYNSRYAVRRLVEAMQEEFFEWQMEQLDDLWDRDGLDYLRDYIDNNGIFDRNDYTEEARDQIMNANPDMPVDSDEFQDLVTELLDDWVDTFVQSSWSNQDEHYDQAREEFNEEFMGNYEEDEWLSDQDLRYMSNVYDRYSDEVQWPYYRSTGGGEMQIDDVANSFEEAIGRPVNAASSYHGGRREPNTYVVEPDGSLTGDDDDDGGLEFVSPPLPLDELLSDMEKVRAWAKQRGCYTNSSTGLHMNVSVPNTSTSKLDYVKLALLLGDEHVLREFGRSSNNYAGSALKKIRDIVQNKPEAATQVLNKMRDHMEALATKVVHSGETQKFTSINTKGNYVEFRSPGGDWLDKNWDKVTPTLLRTVVALDAAMDPAKYRKEYQKKLYKLLNPEGLKDEYGDMIQEFSKYMSSLQGGQAEPGEKLSPETQQAIRDFRRTASERLAQGNLVRAAERGIPGKWFEWQVQITGGGRATVVAYNKKEALEKAAQAWGYDSVEPIRNARITLIGPADKPADDKDDVAGGSGSGRKWGIWVPAWNDYYNTTPGSPREFDSAQAARDFLSDVPASWSDEAQVHQLPNRTPGGGKQKYEIVDRNTGEILTRFEAPNDAEAIEFRDAERVGRLGPTEGPGAEHIELRRAGSGRWGLWITGLNKFATRNNERLEFDSREAARDWYADQAMMRPGIRSDVEIRELPGDSVAVGTTAQPDQGRGAYTYRVYNTSNNQTVGTFQADGVRGTINADLAFSNYLQSIGRDSVAGFNYEEIDRERSQPAAAQPDQGRGAYTYRVFSTLTNQTVGTFQSDGIHGSTNANNAYRRYMQSIGRNDHQWLSYEEIGQERPQAAAQPDLPEVPLDIEVERAPRTLTTPGEPQQQFTGNWLVKDADGNVLATFSGIGNVQADANRVAMDWLRQNPRHMQDGVEVVPEMSE